MADIFVPILNILSGLVSVLVSIIDAVLGLGEILLARLLIVSIVTIVLYKAAIKLVKSPALAFIISFGVSLLGVRLVPEDAFLAVLAPAFVLAITLLFIAFTLFFKTVWWQRRVILFALIVIFAALWYFYARETMYIIVLAIAFFFLVFDNAIHKILAPLREVSEKRRELSLKIKLKQKEIADATAASATDDEMKPLEEEIGKLIKERSKL